MPTIGEAGAITERLALELADFDRVPEDFSRRLGLAHNLDFSETVAAGPHGAVPAVAFKCDLLKAAVICDLLRHRDRKLGRDQTGVYVCKQAAWVRVPDRMQLTVEQLDRTTGQRIVAFNPELFRVSIEAATVALPRPKVVEF